MFRLWTHARLWDSSKGSIPSAPFPSSHQGGSAKGVRGFRRTQRTLGSALVGSYFLLLQSYFLKYRQLLSCQLALCCKSISLMQLPVDIFYLKSTCIFKTIHGHSFVAFKQICRCLFQRPGIVLITLITAVQQPFICEICTIITIVMYESYSILFIASMITKTWHDSLWNTHFKLSFLLPYLVERLFYKLYIIIRNVTNYYYWTYLLHIELKVDHPGNILALNIE